MCYSKIRKCAISCLSTLDLGAVEMIMLARAHNVGKWFEEGARAITTAVPSLPLEDLLPLGADTVCRLLWVREQAPSAVRPTSGGIVLTLSSLKCYKCFSTMFNTDRHCHNKGCRLSLSPNAPKTIYLDKGTRIEVLYPPDTGGQSVYYFSLPDIHDLSCGGPNTHCPLDKNTAYTCPACSTTLNRNQFLIGSSQVEPNASNDNVLLKDIFKDEIAGYRLAEEEIQGAQSRT